MSKTLSEQQVRQPRRARRVAAARLFAADTSGCNACAQSIAALQAPRYARALHAAGIRFTRSPRHADIVLLCGALSRAARASVERVLAAVPEPRALVAVGDCAIDGCVFGGSPELDASLAQTLDAHVEIAGCPPPPMAVLAAIEAALHLLASADEDEETLGGAADGHADGRPGELSARGLAARVGVGEPAVRGGDGSEGSGQA